jgi:hypothetical protein
MFYNFEFTCQAANCDGTVGSTCQQGQDYCSSDEASLSHLHNCPQPQGLSARSLKQMTCLFCVPDDPQPNPMGTCYEVWPGTWREWADARERHPAWTTPCQKQAQPNKAISSVEYLMDDEPSSYLADHPSQLAARSNSNSQRVEPCQQALPAGSMENLSPNLAVPQMQLPDVYPLSGVHMVGRHPLSSHQLAPDPQNLCSVVLMTLIQPAILSYMSLQLCWCMHSSGGDPTIL